MKYTVKYSNRKTLGIMVDRDARLIIKAPEGTPMAKIEEIVEKKKQWIFSKLNHSQKYKPWPPKNYVSGESFLYLGKAYKLDYAPTTGNKLEFTSKFLLPPEKKAEAPEMIKAWYREKAREWIKQRARFFQPYVGKQFNRITITTSKYRWGSCSIKGNLSFNNNIIKAPPSVIDYIIVHELVHLVNRKHNQKFWDTIRAILPDYENSITWLTQHGQQLDSEI